MTVVHTSLDTLPSGLRSVVSVGKFDGVHLGHRAILARMKTLALEKQLDTVLVTFDRNPLELIDPIRCPVSITSLDQKVELLKGLGLDHIVVLEFNEVLKDQAPEEFVELLAKNLGAKLILVGQDFRFGFQGAGDVALLRAKSEQYGYVVELIEDRLAHVATATTTAHLGQRISSSLIRDELQKGLVGDAAVLLGRNHRVTGKVVHGLKRGRELGFPTANLEEVPEGVIPADGIYAGWLTVDGDRYAAAISVGDNPTFDDVFHKQVEAYLPGIDIDLYGKTVTVEFVERIREMIAFEGMEALVRQMQQDETDALRILGLNKADLG